MYTRNGYKKEQTRYPKGSHKYINKIFAWKHNTWPNIFLLYNMNFQHTNIKDIPTSSKTSSFGCFEKANKYYKNESRDSCHDATWKRKDRFGPLQEMNA